jgi:lipopolysaccharide/colanic/teichoic acid biosynthesis glycosyltransferase
MMTILLDACPAYLRSAAAPTSLLLTPLGTSTLLDRMLDHLAVADAQALAVMPDFDAAPSYRCAVVEIVPNTDVIAPGRFGTYLDTCEPSDWLLIVDARTFPIAGFEFNLLLRDLSSSRLARHLVHPRRSTRGASERVVYDGDRQVRSIRRLYENVTQCDPVGVSCSLITVAAAGCLTDADASSVARLRTRLSSCGVPSRDVPASSVALDLTQEENLLCLNERVTVDSVNAAPRSPFSPASPGVWVGPACRIHAASRIYGPVVLHARSEVGAHAIVVGPAVLGPGARVGSRAFVAHSLLASGAQARPGATVVQRVLPAGAASPECGCASADSPPASAFALPALQTLAASHGNGAADGLRHARAYAVAKRALDFVLALGGLLVLFPPLMVVALLVKLTSRGPIFFADEREGRRGNVFRCWKFRTMVDRAHTQQRALYRQNTVDGPQFKMPDDPRVTPLGRWLRKSNIDELPQLFNVLRGEMSLVGPRPSPFRENQYCVPWRSARLSVRPGITGLWQVCRQDRAAGDFHQWIYFDELYVHHASLGLDLRILLATAFTLGGLWSMPLSWMIPARRRTHEHAPNHFSTPARPAIWTPGPDAEDTTRAVAGSS